MKRASKLPWGKPVQVPPERHGDRSTLRFGDISANIPELRRPFKEPPLPLLPFFVGCRRIGEFIDLLACHN